MRGRGNRRTGRPLNCRPRSNDCSLKWNRPTYGSNGIRRRRTNSRRRHGRCSPRWNKSSSMLLQLYEYARQLFNLKQQTEKNAADIKDLQQEMKALAAAIQRLAYEVQRNRENDQHEREKLLLRLENALLRFERRLPPGTAEDERREPL